ncbi:variable large family protein [Borrelia hermsii]|uniref:Variable large protein n=4 Tax=Borrelia hermsii TaxID=140 RepID=Q1CNW0_BORHD|nr:variable large family protein [Borrelia hermsii]ABF82201.1 VlpB9D [Borrelia hermsii DAH]AMR76042.1 Variable large protein B9D [Borrelia hermsii]ANA43844.1 VlpB9 [Borrelia hermsii HS1]UPA08702.1 variable large family protein [Borrelia hermsii DAH]
MRKRISAIIMTLFMVLASCSNQLEAEKLAAESKNTFFDSLVKIGQGFQDIFGIFGNAIGDALGFNAVKSDDKRSKVGEHFEGVGKGLKDTKIKLDGSLKEVTAAPHADTTGVKAVINNAGAVLTKLIDSVAKLAGATKSEAPIGDAGTAQAAAATPADIADVNTVIEGVKKIIEVAEKSGVKIEKGTAGAQVANANGPKVLTNNAQADANSGPALAAEVDKADPWAMIDKIKNAKAVTASAAPAANDDAGQLATGSANAANNGTAATNADLAAAVALKAITKGGKFTQPAANEDGAVKVAAASAVNKVLGILDAIIRKAVNLELGKIKEAVKGIKYSEITGEATESGDDQPITNKSSN